MPHTRRGYTFSVLLLLRTACITTCRTSDSESTCFSCPSCRQQQRKKKPATRNNGSYYPTSISDSEPTPDGEQLHVLSLSVKQIPVTAPRHAVSARTARSLHQDFHYELHELVRVKVERNLNLEPQKKFIPKFIFSFLSFFQVEKFLRIIAQLLQSLPKTKIIFLPTIERPDFQYGPASTHGRGLYN